MIAELNYLFIIILIVILTYLLHNENALELFINRFKKKVEHFDPGVF